MKRLSIIAVLLLTATSCLQEKGNFTSEELSIIESADSIMRVLTIKDSNDLSILRSPSTDLSSETLLSEEYNRLCSLMVATVTHPSQEGVGIAAPQVGLNRRVVAVQRFDKEGKPFEVYPNLRIVWASDSKAAGPEGCLSVPNRRGDVMRSTEIVIEYADVPSAKTGNCPGNGIGENEIQMVRDTVRGFTAVIFQHETDHLDGILYIDRTGNATSTLTH